MRMPLIIRALAMRSDKVHVERVLNSTSQKAGHTLWKLATHRPSSLEGLEVSQCISWILRYVTTSNRNSPMKTRCSRMRTHREQEGNDRGARIANDTVRSVPRMLIILGNACVSQSQSSELPMSSELQKAAAGKDSNCGRPRQSG